VLDITGDFMTAEEQLHAWLEALTDGERTTLGRRYAEAAAQDGAIVYKPDGAVVPIPPLLTPEPYPPADRIGLERDARALVAALTRLTRWLLTDAGAADRARLFHAFSPYEREAFDATWPLAEELATARVDYLVDVTGRPRALEVNATIPAMQGYSDAIAAAFLRAVGRARGLDPEPLVAENGRNSDDLLNSLLSHYRRLGGRAEAPSIAIVARPNDAQRGELLHYVRRFSERGCPSELFTFQDAHLDGGRLTFGGRGFDLVYRHVFARRLDPAGAFARALLDPARHFILNPPASHLEVKGMLAWLSRAPVEPPLAAALGLGAGELDAIARVLPWTRLLERSPTAGPNGAPIADLFATVLAEGGRFVLKRSWDYGGKSVFLGCDHDERAAARAGEAMATGRPLSWEELVRAAVDDPRDVWVVQDLVAFRPRRHLVASATAAPVWKDLYVDRSIYTNLGVEPHPSGGASRAAPGKIVNILGGGGLAPLIRAEVLEKLAAR
jgi:hypothetical protein